MATAPDDLPPLVDVAPGDVVALSGSRDLWRILGFGRTTNTETGNRGMHVENVADGRRAVTTRGQVSGVWVASPTSVRPE